MDDLCIKCKVKLINEQSNKYKLCDDCYIKRLYLEWLIHRLKM